MKQKPLSTQFKFVLTTQQTLKNLDQLKMTNYQRFVLTSSLGKKIQDLAKANQSLELQNLCNKHLFDIPFLKFQIEDAFLSSFNLRNFEVSKYFLDNGFQIQKNVQDAVISLAYSLQYLIDPKQSPLELLELILKYGANPRYAQNIESNTAIHLACQAGSLQFVKILLNYGADINAVNDNKQTPLGLAIKCKRNNIISYLKEKNASENWNS